MTCLATIAAPVTVAPARRHSQPSDFASPGFELGWDYAHHRLVPPAEHLLPGSPVRAGWEAGRDAFGQRTLRATPAVRKWLQLRLGAWLRGKAFEAVQVTPRLLERIAVARCPITGDLLTHGTGMPSDASVDRVNNRAGYAAGNLAVMSARANQAKSDYDWSDAATFVRQIERGRLGQIDGLTARQWARLATLMSYCTPLPHDQAARLPLLVLPPPRLRLLNAVQAVQAALTLAFARPGRVPRLSALVSLFPTGLHREVRQLLSTLLARRMGAGLQASEQALRRALEAAWAEPALGLLWQRIAVPLGEAAFEQIATRLPTVLPGVLSLRHLSLDQATEGWALDTGGLVPLETVTLAGLAESASRTPRREAANDTPLPAPQAWARRVARTMPAEPELPFHA